MDTKLSEHWPSLHDTLTQCWLNVWPASATLAPTLGQCIVFTGVGGEEGGRVDISCSLHGKSGGESTSQIDPREPPRVAKGSGDGCFFSCTNRRLGEWSGLVFCAQILLFFASGSGKALWRLQTRREIKYRSVGAEVQCSRSPGATVKKIAGVFFRSVHAI